MRRFILGCVFASCVFTFALSDAVCRAQQQFPYVAYTNSAETALRSGPGRQYYATDRLEQGTKVEVYQHVDDRWCAIRPPAGSFSWVRAAQLRMTDVAGVAEATVDGAECLIGSRTTPLQEQRWQIKLDLGETVEVLGVQQQRDGQGNWQTWYKIAPPAGEFRWIDVGLLAAEPPLAPPDDTPTATLSSTVGELQAVLPPGAASQPATAPPTDEGPSTDDAFEPVQFVARGNRDRRPTEPAAAATNATGDTFASQLDQIDIELSTMVSQDPSSWQLDDLLQRAETLVETGETALARGRARVLLSKIAKFERLQRRRQNVGPLPTPGASADSATNLAAVEASRRGWSFDGSGWLMPVHSQRQPAPPYALLSADGKVLQYLTPAPGLNLHRYLNQQVGVHGRRGYVPHLETPHLTAEHVKVIGKNTLR